MGEPRFLGLPQFLSCRLTQPWTLSFKSVRFWEVEHVSTEVPEYRAQNWGGSHPWAGYLYITWWWKPPFHLLACTV